MTKQTFTTGQVLTAAQMTSLQQTAMGGGSTTAKTVSYVLVAADAGTVVQMNSATATTITVNTALFAAGDTVQIQNVGAGVCTVTAGTATVSTSATLALKQYDAGTLYFNTTSAAFFFAVDAADSVSPLTTKGDLYGYSTLDARIPIGTNNQVLTADSAQGLGLKWASPANGLTLITSATFSAVTSISLAASTFTSTYTNYKVILIVASSSASPTITGRYRAAGTDNTGTIYNSALSIARVTTTVAVVGSNGTTSFKMGYNASTNNGPCGWTWDFLSPQAAAEKQIVGTGFGYNEEVDTYSANWFGGHGNTTTQFDSFSWISSTGTITGSYYVYAYQN